MSKRNLILLAIASPCLLIWAKVIYSANSSLFQQVILPNDQSISIIDDTNTPIANPTIPIITTISTESQQIITTLGTEQQKIRIINPSFNTPWSVTLAATDGPNALWSNGIDTYDYNDVNVDGTDGPDVDKKGGRLIIDPTTSKIQSVVNINNCPISDLALGNKTAFQENKSSSITLVNGTAQSGSYCQWDITNITLQQTTPANLTGGNYRIDFTLTII